VAFLPGAKGSDWVEWATIIGWVGDCCGRGWGWGWGWGWEAEGEVGSCSTNSPEHRRQRRLVHSPPGDLVCNINTSTAH